MVKGKDAHYKVRYKFEDSGDRTFERTASIQLGRNKELASGETKAYYFEGKEDQSRIPQELNFVKVIEV